MAKHLKLIKQILIQLGKDLLPLLLLGLLGVVGMTELIQVFLGQLDSLDHSHILVPNGKFKK